MRSIDRIKSLIGKLERIGIKIELFGNYPWVYLDKVNGNRVKEKQAGDHGYTIIFQEIRPNQSNNFIDIGDMFKVIRKYR